MQQKSVPMLYERSRTVLRSLYVCPVENVLGRVPVIPCYLNGNTSNTIPHRYRGAIPTEAAADSRPDSGTGSRLFEIKDIDASVALRKNISTGCDCGRRCGHEEATS